MTPASPSRLSLAVLVGPLTTGMLFMAAAQHLAAASVIPIGTVSEVVSLPACPAGFYAGMTCKRASVSCTHLGISSIRVTYGRKNPSGTLKGTIVMHGGQGGTSAFDAGPAGGSTYVAQYLANGFRVVQLAWESDWQVIGAPGNIKNAACRPATILDYIYDTIYLPGAVGGMCAHGQSGGAGALGYALAWYDATSYLDKVLLTAGPPFGDVQRGCLIDAEQDDVEVCFTGQFGCVGDPWFVNPTFSNPPLARIWTGYQTCVTANPPQTDQDAWKAMSIVDGVNGTFGHSQTAVSGWLGSSQFNNESGLAQFYFAEFTASNQTAPYSVNRVDGVSDEQVWNGVTAFGDSTFTASVNDMRSPVRGCIKRH